MQERCNSVANTLSYVFLVLTHQYVPYSQHQKHFCWNTVIYVFIFSSNCHHYCNFQMIHVHILQGKKLWIYIYVYTHIDGILPKGPYPTCLRMADGALLAGYPRYMIVCPRELSTMFWWHTNHVTTVTNWGWCGDLFRVDEAASLHGS